VERVFKENYEKLTVGFAIACDIAFGRIGKNPNVKGKT
jgi:hypothetical protein